MGLGTMILVTFLFGKLRGFIFKRAKKTLFFDPKNPNIAKQYREQTFKQWAKEKYSTGSKEITNCSIARTYKKDDKEKFDGKKLKKAFKLNDKVEWIKDIVSVFNIRKLTIYLTILGCIYGYGYWKGQINTVATINLRGEETYIQLNEHYLHVKPDGTADVVDHDKKTVLKTIKVKDIPSLRKALKPYGFFCKPFFSYGVAIKETEVKQDIGIGITWLKYYKWGIANWLSNNGVWMGAEYKITKNFGILAGVGKSYNGSNMTGIVGRWGF